MGLTAFYNYWKNDEERKFLSTYIKKPILTLLCTAYLSPTALRDIYDDNYSVFDTLLFIIFISVTAFSYFFLLTTVVFGFVIVLLSIGGIICWFLTMEKGAFRVMFAIIPWIYALVFVDFIWIYFEFPFPWFTLIITFFGACYVIGVLWFVIEEQTVFEISSKTSEFIVRVILTVATFIVIISLTDFWFSIFNVFFVYSILLIAILISSLFPG